jgi:DNA-binding winged helix-turn-helix (wHTH) protein/Tfp pilus assembly protein PilF
MNGTSAEPVERDRIRFGPFFLHLSTRQLRHNATIVPLKPKQVELLALLAERLGKPVSRSEIMKRLWGPQRATDFALSQTVNRLRRALEAFDATTDYVRTVPGLGYHLVAPAPSSDQGNLLFADPAFQTYRLAILNVRRRNQAKLAESFGFFEDALKLNPSFIPALIGLAQLAINAGIRSCMDPLAAYYRAKAALAKAVALDPAGGDAFALLSLLVLFFDADAAHARDAAEQAIALAPQSPKARCAMLWQLLARQDYSAALIEADRAVCASPCDARATTLLGIVTYFMRRYDEACEHFARSLLFAPVDTPTLFYYACAQHMAGRHDHALALLNRMPGTEMVSRELALRGCIAIVQGRVRARRHFEKRIAALPFPSDASLAVMLAANDGDGAADSLAKSLETREPGLFLASIDPLYEPVWRSHPELMARIREGRSHRCDRCAAPLAWNAHPLYALRLCERCSA